MRAKIGGRRLWASLLAIRVIAVLAACSGSTGGSSTASVSGGTYKGPAVTINFWNGWTGGAAPVLVPKLVAQFNKEHKNITVKDVPLEWANIAAKMPLAIKAGKGPDVAVAHGDDIATYAAQGLLLDAGDIIKTLKYSSDDFPSGGLHAPRPVREQERFEQRRCRHVVAAH